MSDRERLLGGSISQESVGKDTDVKQCNGVSKHIDEKTPLTGGSAEIAPGRSQTFVCWYVYVSHFLSAWGDRMWQFGVGLFLVIISPDSLFLTALYGFAMGAAILIFGPIIGDWVDRTPRLSAARISLIVQNLSIAVCAAAVYFVIIYKSEIETQWPDYGLQTLCYAGIILIAVIAQLASTGNTIAVEKDWIAEICGTDKDLLATTSAILKSIDLITNIVAPIATGQIMTYASTEIGAIFIGGWNVISVFVEYYLLWKVYTVVPALRAVKDKCVVDKDIENQESGKCASCMKGLLGSFLTLIRGWKTFMKYEVAFAGLGLASLYMTVLGFDNITVGFAYTQGINESIMGGLMAAGALVGILGTIIYPRMRKCIGQQRTGLFGLTSQLAFLTLCVASVWAKGSPFDLNYASKASESDDVLDTNSTAFPPLFNSTSIPPLFNNTTPVPFNDTSLSESETWEDYISVGLLMTGIIGARCGLWIADLTITQLFLEAVVEQERGIVFGVQNSLNQLMDTLKFVMVIVAPEPEVFGLLVLISFAFVSMGYVLYTKYVCSVRGQLSRVNSHSEPISGVECSETEIIIKDDSVKYKKDDTDYM